MPDIPAEILERRDEYCEARSRKVVKKWGHGVDGFVWQVSLDSVVKVFRHPPEFQQELAVYQRLQERGVQKLQGFQIPALLDYDENLLVLELSLIFPPYVLDFAAATLDSPPPGFDPESPDWIDEKRRLFGSRWPEVQRLLDALRHLGIHYRDVHAKNILFKRNRRS